MRIFGMGKNSGFQLMLKGEMTMMIIQNSNSVFDLITDSVDPIPEDFRYLVLILIRNEKFLFRNVSEISLVSFCLIVLAKSKSIKSQFLAREILKDLRKREGDFD